MNAPLPSEQATLTLIEIAAATGISKQAAQKKALKEAWNFSEVPHPGGKKRLYPISSLPKDVREKVLSYKIGAVAQAAVPVVASPVAAHTPAPTIPTTPAAPLSVAHPGGLTRRIKGEDALDDKDRARRDGALVICRAINEAVATTGCSVKRAISELSGKILGGVAYPELLDAATITYTKPRAGGQTLAALISRLQKMYAAFQQGELAGDAGMYLVPGKAVKRGQTPVDIHAFLVHYCRPTQPPVMEAWKSAASWYAHHGLKQPAVDTWYRIQKELPVTLKYRGRMTGSAYKSLLPYVARDVSMFKSNDLWVGDGHSFKAKVQHPIHGQPFTPEVTIILDWVSRKIVGWSVDMAESCIAVSAALRHAHQQTRARPLIYYSDNGSGQTAKQLDSPIHGTLARLGIAHETGIPGNPQGRGIIERLWQVVTYPLARTYATYTGKKGDQETIRKMLQALNRKDGSSERLLPSFGQFLLDLDAAINQYNTSHEHRELGGLTPEQAYQAKLDPDSIDMGITDQELATMWLPGEVRTPQRGSLVSLFGNEYCNKDLVNLLAEGEKVIVRFDIHNADKVWLTRLDGRYLGEAIWDGHKRAAFPVAYVEQKREERAEGKISRAERDIAEARAELGNVIAGEVLNPVIFDPIERKPELVPVEFDPIAPEEKMNHHDSMAWLWGTPNPDEDGEHPVNEVAAL